AAAAPREGAWETRETTAAPDSSGSGSAGLWVLERMGSSPDQSGPAGRSATVEAVTVVRSWRAEASCGEALSGAAGSGEALSGAAGSGEVVSGETGCLSSEVVSAASSEGAVSSGEAADVGGCSAAETASPSLRPDRARAASRARLMAPGERPAR